MKYQTDFTGYIQKDGCLACSIVRAAENLVKLEMSTEHFLEMIDYLHFEARAGYNSNIPVLSAEDDIHKPGAFVWDHTSVFNETFKKLGTHHRVTYSGRIYMPWEEARGKKSFGTPVGDIIILQIQTPNTGHFRLIDFDPYEPGTKMVNLKSLRYYTLN